MPPNFLALHSPNILWREAFLCCSYKDNLKWEKIATYQEENFNSSIRKATNIVSQSSTNLNLMFHFFYVKAWIFCTLNRSGLTHQLWQWTLGWCPSPIRQRHDGHSHRKVAKHTRDNKEVQMNHTRLLKAKCGGCPKRSHMLPHRDNNTHLIDQNHI